MLNDFLKWKVTVFQFFWGMMLKEQHAGEANKALDFLKVTAYGYKMARREKLLARALNNPKGISF